MKYKDLVTIFVRGWNFTRSETRELLESLNDEQLLYKPKGEKWQPLFWEFGCIGRTQMVYTQAIKTGKMDFSFFSSSTLPKKDEFKTKKDLLLFLQKTDKAWIEVIREKRQDEDYKIAWPGFTMPLVKHISKLAEHERIHHGQFIAYFTMAGFDLPTNFKSNWAL